MKAILILFTLLLTFAWAYTSWYWYTCNIKGFCDITSFSFTNDSKVQEAKAKLMPERVIKTQEISDQQSISQNTQISQNPELPRVITRNEDDQELPEEITADQVIIVEADEVTLNLGASTCATPLTGPIEFGKNNNSSEVEILEKFLISQGENISVDGKYQQADFEAVKRFQLKYKSEILDPWDITEPTGFVFRTTVKKINEIACQ